MSGEQAFSTHDVLRMDLGNLYPWASGETLSNATALVAEHLDRYEHDDTYTLERFEKACALGDELAALVGPTPNLPGQAVPSSRPLIIADTLYRAAVRLLDNVQHLRTSSPPYLLRGSGKHDRRRTH